MRSPKLRLITEHSLLWWRLLWVSATLGAIGAMVLPLTNFQGHSHWAKVVWIPFGERSPALSDVLANILLFIPFGLCAVQSRSGSSRKLTVQTTVFALLLSASGEFFQIFCHNRVPSMTDVCTNTFGAFLGATIAVRFTATGWGAG